MALVAVLSVAGSSTRLPGSRSFDGPALEDLRGEFGAVVREIRTRIAIVSERLERSSSGAAEAPSAGRSDIRRTRATSTPSALTVSISALTPVPEVREQPPAPRSRTAQSQRSFESDERPGRPDVLAPSVAPARRPVPHARSTLETIERGESLPRPTADDLRQGTPDGPQIDPARESARPPGQVIGSPAAPVTFDRAAVGDGAQVEKPLERLQKAARPERADKVEATEPIERAQRTERPERAAKLEKIEKVEKADRSERPARPERVEKVARPERVEKVEKVERPAKPERVEKVEKVEKPDKPERLAKVEKPEKPVRPGK